MHFCEFNLIIFWYKIWETGGKFFCVYIYLILADLLLQQTQESFGGNMLVMEGGGRLLQ